MASRRMKSWQQVMLAGVLVLCSRPQAWAQTNDGLPAAWDDQDAWGQVEPLLSAPNVRTNGAAGGWGGDFTDDTPFRGRDDDRDDWQEGGAITSWPVREPEPEKPWRDDALARIEAHRKADLSILIVDADGEPVEGARVSVRMLRHEFGFGSAVAAKFLVGDDPNVTTYRERVKRLFNRVTIESDLKWPHWEDLENRDLAIRALKWLRENGLPVRGHCLVWAGWSWMPDDIYDLKDDPDALRRRVTDHIVGEVLALRGQLAEWDVVNEPRWYDEIQRRLGRECMVDWFRLVRQFDPTPKLFINEYGILSDSWGYSYGTPSWKHYKDTIQSLLEQGAPIDGIGLQGHFSWTLTSPWRVLDTLDQFAEFGKPLLITEFDIDTSDEQRQADYMRDFMTAAFSHPAVQGIIMWGFWEGRHWRPDSALFRLDWSVKPCGRVWEQLVFDEWWTDSEITTDGGGRGVVRGFRGDYEVVACAPDGLRKSVRVALPAGGRELTVRVGLLSARARSTP